MKDILILTKRMTLQITDLLLVAVLAYLSLFALNGPLSSELFLSAWQAILFDSVLILVFFTAWSFSPVSSIMNTAPFFSRERLFAMPFSLLITALALAAARALGLITEDTGIIVLLLILAVVVPFETLIEKSLTTDNKNVIDQLLEAFVIFTFFLSLTGIWLILLIGRLALYELISTPEWLEIAVDFILNNSLEWLEKNA